MVGKFKLFELFEMFELLSVPEPDEGNWLKGVKAREFVQQCFMLGLVPHVHEA